MSAAIDGAAARDALFAKHKEYKAISILRDSVKPESNRWWLKAALPLRGYLLAASGVDDVYKFVDTPWGSLPDGLRASIVVNTRSLRREIDGCGWL